LAAAKHAQRHWGLSSWTSRASALSRFADALERRSSDIITADALSSGACRKEAAASLQRSIAILRCAASAIAERDYSKKHEGATAELIEPIGVCAILTSSCNPVEAFCRHASAALVTGNAVVWKPSENSLLPSFVVAEILAETADALFPRGVVNVVQGGPIVGGCLCHSEHTDLLGLVGSPATAAAVRLSCAQMNSAKKMLFECERNSALVIGTRVSSEEAAAAAMGGFVHSGQSRNAIRRVYVRRTQLMPFLESLARRIASRRIGHALDPDVDQGPMINAASLHRVRTTLESTVGNPSIQLVVGGFSPSFPRGYFYAPTVIVCEESRASIVREPVDGPILRVIPVDESSDAHAIAQLCNDPTHIRGAWVLTRDPSEASGMVDALHGEVVRVGDADHNSWWDVIGDPRRRWGDFTNFKNVVSSISTATMPR
jgi:acyl-CoA reductase-like NAD-dependent aldehyde dehydrogenase